MVGTLCTDIAIKMTVDLGDIPMITATSSLTLTASTASIVLAETTKGTLENVECSNAGTCGKPSPFRIGICVLVNCTIDLRLA